MAMADVHDALISKRVYKPPMSREETREEIRGASGSAFDPAMTEIMPANIGLFEDIHRKYQDVS